MPSSHSLAKFESTPMVKKVITKKMPRKTLASPIAALALPSTRRSAQADQQDDEEGERVADDELRKTFPDLAPAARVSPGRRSMMDVQMTARMNAHTPMKTSMNTFTVVVVPTMIHPAWYFTPCTASALARISESVMAPLATAAPSVFTASPIHAPATIGSL